MTRTANKLKAEIVRSISLAPKPQAFAKMIKAGKYDIIDTDITEKNFKLDAPTRLLEIELIKFRGFADFEDIRAWMEERKRTGVTLSTLLDIGVQFPSEPGGAWFVAIESSWTNEQEQIMVPFLHALGARRYLTLHNRAIEIGPQAMILSPLPS
jgi:hypothetical protein